MIKAFVKNWRIYLIEAWALGMFMVSACIVVILIEHPYFNFSSIIPTAFYRRLIIALAMGITAILLIYSKWGKQSGAHMNPAVTLANYQLGRISLIDATWYIIAQSIGAAFFVFLFKIFAYDFIADKSVNYVVTQPSNAGVVVAFVAEMLLAFIMFTTVLIVSNSKWAKYTGYIAGLLVFLFIWWEAPLSGMSINPARTFGSAIVANNFNSFWLYLIAPICGMQLAAYLYRKYYFNTNQECETMQTYMSGAAHNNVIQKVWCWYKLNKDGTIAQHKISEQ